MGSGKYMSQMGMAGEKGDRWRGKTDRERRKYETDGEGMKGETDKEGRFGCLLT